MKRYFSLSEANQLLPMVKLELEQLQQIKKKFETDYKSLKDLKNAGVENEELIFKLECESEFQQIQADIHIKNIHSQGIQLKDIDTGLIDFPALIDGEEVLLCWRIGEDEIEHYHGVNEGFTGRKPLK